VLFVESEGILYFGKKKKIRAITSNFLGTKNSVYLKTPEN
jgi:hypothetical protein